jgi:hypothetical protein
MNRAHGSWLIMIGYGNWTKVQPYKMCRAAGSEKCESSIGTTNIVATDLNPLVDKMNPMLSSVGTNHIVATDFNPLKSMNIVIFVY